MKRFYSIGIICVLLLGMAGCREKEEKKAQGFVENSVDAEAQEAVRYYVDTTSVSLKEQEQKVLESYSSVIGENYKDDTTLCLELVTNTIPMATRLQSAAEAITETITEEELLEVHELYVSYATEFVDALRLLLKAVDEQDESVTREANEKLGNADGFAKEFRAGLQELKEKYKLED